MNTEDLQKTINHILKVLGWSRRAFAEVLLESRADDEVESDRELSAESPEYKKKLNRYAEKIKKDLTEPTVSPELLSGYLEVLKSDPQYKRIASFVPSFKPLDDFYSDFDSELYNISKHATKLAKKNL